MTLSEALLDIRLLARLPEKSPERAWADTAFRALCRSAFELRPALALYAGRERMRFFSSFHAWAADRNFALDWRLYLHMLDWVVEIRGKVCPALVRQLLAASASQWTYVDKTAARSIVIRSPHLVGRAPRRKPSGCRRNAAFS